jgi:hypothetical protein
VKNIYVEGTYLNYNPTWHVEHSPWKAGQIIKILNKNNVNPGTICEVGCGGGEILNQLFYKLSPRNKYIGYDISPQAIEIARSIKNDKLEFLNKDFFADSNSFYDVLLIMDVVEHVENYIGFLTNIKERGTYKIFHFPLDLNVLIMLRSKPLLETRKAAGHIHYFTKDIVVAVLNDLGYEIIDSFYTDLSSVVPPKSIKMKILNLFRKYSFKINKDFAAKMFGGYSLLVLTK